MKTFSISADGNFSFLPEGNFSGVVDFTLKAESLEGSVTHDFDVNVSAQPDSPVFLLEQGVDLEPVWVGEAFSQEILVFDSDSDPLTLTASGLPTGLRMTNNDLEGNITDNIDFNGEDFKDFNISIEVSDGTETLILKKPLISGVRPQEMHALHLLTGCDSGDINIMIEEDCNESRWREVLGEINF